MTTLVKNLLLSALLFGIFEVTAARADDAAMARLGVVKVHSACMNKDIEAAVMVPTSYADGAGRKYPVIYFLDGHSGDGKRLFYDFYKDELMKQSDQFNVIMVAVGGFNTWYFDSPVNPEVKWQQFLTKELIPFVDASYRTIAKREGRAITGLSMGGHGSFYTAFRHPELFIAAGSTSGGVDFRSWPDNWDIAAMLGKKSEHEKNWDEGVVINNLNALPKAKMALYFDCGVNDFFLEVNRALDKKMTDMKIVHSYEEFPGGHTQDYWGRSLPKHVEYFSKHLATGK
jgi:S-formylglutathione hydrolase FrmB